VKIIDAAGHSRLDRQTALAPHLPAGLTAPFPGGSLCRLATREVRYARVPGAAPGMGMPGVDDVTARLLAADAVQRLGGLHSWMPAGRAEQTLREPLDHDGFISQAALCAGIENLAAFRGRQNAKLQYAVLAAAALHGGTEPDLLDEVAWLQADDFWQYALFAAVAYIRAAASRAGVPVRQACQDLTQSPGHPAP